MKFYHGSRNKDLKELTTDHYGGKVYITDSYAMALFYAGCPIRYWDFDKINDVLLINEPNLNAFDIMYKNVECYIYTCEVEDAIKDEGNRSNHTYTVNHNVKLDENKEVIKDAFAKLLELEKLGKLKLRYFKDLPVEMQKEYKEEQLNFWKTHPIDEKEYPESYNMLIKIFPELKAEEVRKK